MRFWLKCLVVLYVICYLGGSCKPMSYGRIVPLLPTAPVLSIYILQPGRGYAYHAGNSGTWNGAFIGDGRAAGTEGTGGQRDRGFSPEAARSERR